MHIHQQNHWNDTLFYWYHWYQWTISLTNRIRLCILDMCVNNSSASVFKPQLAKLACSVSVMWRSIDRLHSLIGTYSVLKFLALEPHSPPTSAPYSHSCGRQSASSGRLLIIALATKNFISNENRANKEIDDSERRSH